MECITCGNTQIDTAKVGITVHKMANTDPNIGLNGFEHQFQVHKFISWEKNKPIIFKNTRLIGQSINIQFYIRNADYNYYVCNLIA